MTSRSDLGQFLRKARETKGLQQKDVADHLGMSQGWYSNIERGALSLHPRYADGLTQILGITYGEIADHLVTMLTDVERAIRHDQLLSKKDRKLLLLIYGELTGRNSLTMANAFYSEDAE